MATASRSLATALLRGALRERLAPPSYTTSWDVTSFEPQSTLGDPRVNSVKQAIREAAEKGGYRYRSWRVNDLEPNEGYNALQLRALPEHLHDPDFWKALATARKWEDVNAWRFHWHRFIDHLADGGDVDSFFAALRNSNTIVQRLYPVS